MAVRTGTGGFCQMADTGGASITGTPAAPKMSIGRWSLDMPLEELDVTAFHPTNNTREAIIGNGSLTGSFEGFFDDTNIFNRSDFIDPEATAQATITLQFNRADATTLDFAQRVTFTAMLTGFAVGVRVKELNTVNCTFVGTGAPTFEKATPLAET